ncbi:hypothetical protein JH06_3644 [Blastocystis sp. subtype 4]|uniref:hypothetical protein n=1 Tax=Blastocystis sp. subtype 4 TaxID=944170 RepID=UPI0007115D97|nr:hypothetical protein JH06_3644 [Blastocystis sp. subtype 4]KNB42683.1 hypothetical protein JH06_3644 [Blastocystis sp. subtype 4]|eukprot:XP_014526126.1 hypothetical protein JH06_3644 [Blastocystis sp. subtype 4]
MDEYASISEVAKEIRAICLSFPTIENSNRNHIPDSWTRDLNQQILYIQRLHSIEVQQHKKDICSSKLTLQPLEELKNELREVLIDNYLKKRKELYSYEEALLSLIGSNSRFTEQEEKIQKALKTKDQLFTQLQSVRYEYEQIEEKCFVLLDHNLGLKSSADSMVHRLHTEDQTIQQKKQDGNVEMLEEKRVELEKIKRKYERQRIENALLRNIYSSLVLGSKLDWARNPRIRELMLCCEEEPGVPEKDIS